MRGEIENALIALQRCITPEETWAATRGLMLALMPARYHVLGLPSLGIMPFYLRTTMPTRDMGRFSELAPLNRVVATKPGLEVARMSDFYSAAPGDPFYEEFLKHDGWLHAAAMLFWGKDRRFIGQLAALRSREQGDFTEAELARLRAYHPHVKAALTRLLALESAAATQVSLEHSLHTLPLSLAVVAWDLTVAFANKSARAAMQPWRHGAAAGRALKPAQVELPEIIRAGCQRLKDGWSEAVRKHDFSRLTRELTLVHPEEPRQKATIRLVEPPGGRALHPSWIIHFEAGLVPNREVARALDQLAQLSQAEKTVAMLAAAGHDNEAIARELGRSLSTVRTHLRNIFRKLGITTRARLAPLLPALRAGLVDGA